MSAAPHVPVLLTRILRHCAPVRGVWIDGTFGAGGYARGLLEAGAERVVGIDRDPAVRELAAPLLAAHGARLTLATAPFSALDEVAAGPADGVVLDLGVSSMQLDQPARGFSFLRDGPLDMRMGRNGRSAADLVASASEAQLADIFYHYGEERASRRIARAIVAARSEAPIDTTAKLAGLIEGVLPRARPGQSHPATRSFQALRIAVNDEFGELVAGLEAAERSLVPGGWLAVVSFHSLEDRIVKRFLQQRGARTGGGGSRHAPASDGPPPAFDDVSRGIPPDDAEIDANPRARSARLRAARRTDAPARAPDRTRLGLPRPTKDLP